MTPLPPQDEFILDAVVETDDGVVHVSSHQAMVENPTGAHTTWWGVGLDVEHHGASGIGTSRLPPIRSEAAGFGLGDVAVDDEVVATGVPVHFMTAEGGLPGGAALELDVGAEFQDVPGLPAGHLRVLWDDYRAQIEDPSTVRYVGGLVVLIALARRRPLRQCCPW